MGWNEEMGAEREMLERIVALLLALAGLADRAAFASGSTRCRMLWALRQANAAALDLVAGRTFDLAGQQWAPALVTARSSAAPVDAMNLAAALRALAFVVRIMALRIRSRSTLACVRDGSRQAGANGPIEALSAALAAVGPCDTS